jgi:hypothetical protein
VPAPFPWLDADEVGFYGSLQEWDDLRAAQEAAEASGRLLDTSAADLAWLGVDYSLLTEGESPCR